MPGKSRIPSERTSNDMGNKVEIISSDELGHEKTWIKGGPGIQSGGTPSDLSGGHLSPGGECFALFGKDSISEICISEEFSYVA